MVWRPDVVLLEMGLPGMDGYQVAQLRKLWALSFTPSEADYSRQQQTGFDHHLVKPMPLQMLLELFVTVQKQRTVREKNVKRSAHVTFLSATDMARRYPFANERIGIIILSVSPRCALFPGK